MYVANYNGGGNTQGTISQISFANPSYSLNNPTWATSIQGLYKPAGLVISNPYMYVAEYNTGNVSGNHKISQITLANPTSYNASWWGSFIEYPYAMVMNKTNTILYYTTLGNQIRYVNTNLGGNGGLANLSTTIYGMAIDNTNTYLYAVCADNTLARVLLSNGTTNATFATSTQGLNAPKALLIDKTNTYIYILNSGTNTIGKYSLTSPTSDYNATWATSIGLNNPLGIVTDSSNTYMYVVNNGNNTVTQLAVATPTTYQTYATNASAGLFNPVGIAIDASNTYIYVSNQTGGTNTLGTISQISLSLPGPTPGPPVEPPCFLAGTRILTDEGYVQIQHLRTGDLIQTLCHGLVPIDVIGFKTITHPAQKERIKEQLYKYSTSTTPDLIEDLILTGCHSVLVDEFTSPEQRENTLQILGDIYITDDKYRLPACLDENASVFEVPGEYTIYHFALENADYYMNYGVFASGLLVESSSKRYMKECSQMVLMP